MRSPKELGIAGYLTFRDGDEDGRPMDRWQVTFFSAGDPPSALCRVCVPMQRGATPEFASIDPATPMSDDAQRMIRARRAALAAIGPSAQPQNQVILPGQAIGKDGILVYLLAGSTRNDVAVLGKHHRVLVSPDGETVVSVEPLSKTVLEIPLALPPGAVGAGLYVTHLVTAWPLETHVFVSLLHRTPVSVVTSRGNWVVEGARISLLPAPEPPSPPPGASRRPAGSSPQRTAPAASGSPPIEPAPRFNAILSRKPWWRFW
ncbi:MAG TPA: hypothetical protein VHT91_47495 [Kofleriaceae bacterium]|nr:hypothetical protein [Kofleriaceae bacterium]